MVSAIHIRISPIKVRFKSYGMGMSSIPSWTLLKGTHPRMGFQLGSAACDWEIDEPIWVNFGTKMHSSGFIIIDGYILVIILSFSDPSWLFHPFLPSLDRKLRLQRYTGDTIFGWCLTPLCRCFSLPYVSQPCSSCSVLGLGKSMGRSTSKLGWTHLDLIKLWVATSPRCKQIKHPEFP